MISIQKAKHNLETELTRLAHQMDVPTAFANLQRQYQSKIGQLEQQLEQSDLAKSAAARINEHVDRQHAEIRRLILSSGPGNDSFRNRLLRELQLAHDSDAVACSSRFLFPPSTPYASPTAENGSLRRRANEAIPESMQTYLCDPRAASPRRTTSCGMRPIHSLGE